MKKILFLTLFMSAMLSAGPRIVLKADTVLEEIWLYLQSPYLLKTAMLNWAGYTNAGVCFRYEATAYCIIVGGCLLLVGLTYICLFVLKKGQKAKSS